MQNTNKNENNPLARLRHHVTGAIERGEKTPIVAVTDEGKAPHDPFEEKAIGLLQMAHINLEPLRVSTLTDDLKLVSAELKANLYDATPNESWLTLRKRIGGTENLMSYSNCLIVGKA